ncbi:ligand-binding sensor domain-containing protein [Aliikangiella maris]|uniref:Two-component regulator propeller domain-containing protein n=2 Tax=Aliikangiella maris TaxID=3162458 RepID=A0ABV2BZH4_9GAMM
MIVSKLHATNLDASLPFKDYVHLQWKQFGNNPLPPIFAMVQDDDGYLWMATYNGVIRFDGKDFSYPPALPVDNIFRGFIKAIQVTPDQSIWFTSSNLGIARIKDDKFFTYKVENGLLSNTISSMTVSPQGQIWYGNQEGIGRFNNDKFETVLEFKNGGIAEIKVISENEYWFVTYDGIVYHHHNGKISVWDKTDGLPADALIGLLIISNDNVLLLSRHNGVYRLTTQGIFPAKEFDSLNGLAMNGIKQTDDGAIWIAHSNGVSRYFNQSLVHEDLGYPNELGARVKGMFIDKQGNFWLGLYSEGLHRFSAAKVRIYNLSNNRVSANTVIEHHDQYWIGSTKRGLIGIPHTKKSTGKPEISIYLEHENGPARYISSLMSDSKGNLWIGTREGLRLLKNHAFKKYTSNAEMNNNQQLNSHATTKQPVRIDGTEDFWISALFEMSDGRILIGTNKGLYSYQNHQITREKVNFDLSKTSILWIKSTIDGRVWFGTHSRTYYEEGGLWRYFNQPLLIKEQIKSIHLDKDGGLWLGSLSGEGLSWLKNNRLVKFTTEDGLFDNYMWSIQEDSEENLWFSSDKGISRIKRQQLEDYANEKIPQINSLTLSKYDGLATLECNGGSPAGSQTTRGSFIYPCMEGLVEIFPEKFMQKPPIPKNIVESISVGEQLVATEHFSKSNQVFNIDKKNRDIKLKYTAISYYNPEKIEFKYRLIGYQNDWIMAEGRREVFYTNLNAGDYTFEVNSRYHHDKWSKEPARFRFSIASEFYETYYFKLIFVMLLISIIYWLTKWRIKVVTQRQYEVEHKKIEHLSTLVNSIAHHLNTPIGTGITSASYQKELLSELTSHLNSARVSKIKLLELLKSSSNALTLMTNAFDRSAHIIELFKQIKIDEKNDSPSEFYLKNLVEQLTTEIKSHYEKRQFNWRIFLDESIKLTSYPNAIKQVILILADNSIAHGYQADQEVSIDLSFKILNKKLHFTYRDYGRGLKDIDTEFLFTPFNKKISPNSGLGLGMSIAYSTVTQKLKGQLKINVAKGSGAEFLIIIPLQI